MTSVRSYHLKHLISHTWPNTGAGGAFRKNTSDGVISYDCGLGYGCILGCGIYSINGEPGTSHCHTIETDRGPELSRYYESDFAGSGDSYGDGESHGHAGFWFGTEDTNDGSWEDPLVACANEGELDTDPIERRNALPKPGSTAINDV